MDVASLIQQMQDVLSEINNTITGLSARQYDARLGELEQRRDQLLTDLRARFDKGKKALESKHKAEIEDIKEKRRKEDEEREARRRQEDEELRKKNSKENIEKKREFDEEVNSVENETAHQMDDIERKAQEGFENDKQKLYALEEKRREINRQIDEKLSMPLPAAPTRKRVRGEKGAGDFINAGGNKFTQKTKEKPSENSNGNAVKRNKALTAEPTPTAPGEMKDENEIEPSRGDKLDRPSQKSFEKTPKKPDQPTSKDPANSSTGKPDSNETPRRNQQQSATTPLDGQSHKKSPPKASRDSGGGKGGM
ncbi:hypothetical protein F4779DRAFT_137670 [Xylariaceae sp. FL0662B]|nr:hypothetical protein F4779DRAFT_137670 [Xylariaceae sp. FL0662B]